MPRPTDLPPVDLLSATSVLTGTPATRRDPQVGRAECPSCEGYGYAVGTSPIAEDCRECHGSGVASRCTTYGCGLDVVSVDDGRPHCSRHHTKWLNAISIDDIEWFTNRRTVNGRRYVETYAIVTWRWLHSDFVTVSDIGIDYERADRSVGYGGGWVASGRKVPRELEELVEEQAALRAAEEAA